MLTAVGQVVGGVAAGVLADVTDPRGVIVGLGGVLLLASGYLACEHLPGRSSPKVAGAGSVGPTTTTKGHTVRDLTQLIDTYLAAYSEPDPARREQLVAQAWSDEGRLIDPPMQATGRDEIHAMAGAVQQQFPGARFRRASTLQEHHGLARYAWELVDRHGEVALAGTDVADVAPDGRLARVVGFFGDLEAT
jgi:hypothetical protein